MSLLYWLRQFFRHVRKNLGMGGRVPVIRQSGMTECGASALAMILSYYGRKTSRRELLSEMQPGRDGTTAYELVQEGRQRGLRTKAYTTEPQNLKYLDPPYVVHWKFNHYLVVEKWHPRGIEVVDPASGRRLLPADEFSDGFTGVVINFEPGADFQRRMRSGEEENWREYLREIVRLPGAWKLAAQVIVASLLLQALGLVLPAFTKILVDEVLPYQVTGVLTILGVGVVLLAVTKAFTQYVRATLLIYLQARLDMRLVSGLFERLLLLPFRYFQQRDIGDVISRLNSSNVIRDVLTNRVLSTVLDSSLVVIYLLILFSQSTAFGLITGGMGLLQILVLVISTPKVNQLMRRDIEERAAVQSFQVEALRGIATLKASGAEDRVYERWENLFQRQLNASFRKGHVTAMVSAGMSLFTTLAPLLILWVGTSIVLDGEMTLGTMLALVALAQAALQPIGSLVAAGQQIQQAWAHLVRILDIVDHPLEQPTPQPRPNRLSGRIDLRNVSFRFQRSGDLIVQNVSLSVPAGSKVAIVGKTGAGKSTLASLLVGLYEPESGTIAYDGQPLASLDYRSVRRQFGVVLQDPFLFSGSIRRNIAFSDPSMSLASVRKAAQIACIDEEIDQMPMGYDTLIGEAGSSLSGGQRQRLSLARALAANPVVLLLDEATSHLDTYTEKQVDQRLDELDCTRIVIAHRLSTVQNSDAIVVIEQGRIEDVGTHSELAASDGLYTKLIDSQLADGDN